MANNNSSNRSKSNNNNSYLTLRLEDLHLAQPKVVGLLPVIPHVDELPRQANRGLVPSSSSSSADEGRPPLRKRPLELGAWLVEGLVALEELCLEEEENG